MVSLLHHVRVMLTPKGRPMPRIAAATVSLLLALPAICHGQAAPAVPASATFNNPLLPSGADPWVIYSKEKDAWYLIQSAFGGITVHESRDLTKFDERGVTVWTPPGELKELWAPGSSKLAFPEEVYVD